MPARDAATQRCRLNRIAQSRLGGIAAASTIMLLTCGCREQAVPEASKMPSSTAVTDQRPLKMVVVDDVALAAAAAREWTARASRRLEIVNVGSAELASWLSSGARELGDVDAMILASHWVGDLAGRGLIQPMPDYVRTSRAFADGEIGLETDILPLYRQSVMTWGDSICGLPLGGHVYVLGYRKDVFDALNLPVPDTIASLREALETYVAAEKLDAWPSIAIVQPLAKDWAVHTFLARAAPYCRHRNRFSALFELQSMQPEISGPEYVRALQEIAEDAGRVGESPAEHINTSPVQAFQSLFGGQCLVAIGWPGAYEDHVQEEVLQQITILELPGSHEVYSRFEGVWQQRLADEATHVPYAFPDDRMAVVLKSSRSENAAWNLIARLSGKQWGPIVSDASAATGPFRRSQLTQSLGTRNLPRGLADQYRDVLESTMARRTFLSRLRLPANQEYLDTLDEAVRKFLSGPAEPDAAIRSLEDVAAAWQQITERQGRAAQIDAFHCSLGLEP